jgi:MATE family multidrug resistance protein
LLNFIVRGATLGWKYPALEAEADKRGSGPVAAA